MALPLTGSSAAREWLATPEWELEPAIDPTGRWVAYTNGAGDAANLRIRPFEGLGEVREITQKGGVGPIWSPDGRRIYYRDRDAVMAVEIGADGRIGGRRLLFKGNYPWRIDLWGRTACLHPDGKRFLLAKEETARRVRREIRVVLGGLR